MSDKELKEIIENINIEFWTQEIAHDADVLQGSNKIRLLDITRDDLINEFTENIRQIGCVQHGDWDALKNFLPEKEINLEKEEAELYMQQVREGCDCMDDVCKCDYRIYRAILYCEGQYVWSCQGADKFPKF